MHTYIVRIVSPADDAELRGVVRRVADGAEDPFHGAEQLLTLLQADPGADPDTAGGCTS